MESRKIRNLVNCVSVTDLGNGTVATISNDAIQCFGLDGNVIWSIFHTNERVYSRVCYVPLENKMLVSGHEHRKNQDAARQHKLWWFSLNGQMRETFVPELTINSTHADEEQYIAPIKEPFALTVLKDNIIISDSSDNLIYLVDCDGFVKHRFPGNGKTQHLTWLSGPELIVASSLDVQTVTAYGQNGDVFWKYGGKGSSKEYVNIPSGMCSAPEGQNLILADCMNHRVVLISPSGVYIRDIINQADNKEEDDRIQFPQDVSLCPQGNLLVARYEGLFEYKM